MLGGFGRENKIGKALLLLWLSVYRVKIFCLVKEDGRKSRNALVSTLLTFILSNISK